MLKSWTSLGTYISFPHTRLYRVFYLFSGHMTIVFGVYSECTEEIREAAAAVMLVAGWCGELPELPFARTILADKFGSDFAEAAKDGTGIVDPMVLDSIYCPVISQVNFAVVKMEE